MHRRLAENLNIDGANYLGTAHNYDVYDILTYEAAQQFNIEDRNDPAGAAYTQNQSTFNSNINESQHLYFFTKENTNQVYGAIVKSASTRGNVTFVGSDGAMVVVECNFLYENAGENSSKTYYDRPLPFFLVPEAKIVNGHERIDNYSCLYIKHNVLKAALIQFSSTDMLDIDALPEEVDTIHEKAFNYGVEVGTIKLDENIISLPSHCMDKVHNRILVTMFESPDSWDEGWNAGKENITVFGYGADPEEVARREQEIAATQEAERIRREEEAQRQAEEERRRAEREARKLRYKVRGKEVIITGTISGISELTIPAEIEGKPVTTIAAYAFFDETDLRYVNLPNTIKLIEQGAFFGSNVTSIMIPRDCVVSKYNNNIAIHRRIN